MADEPNFDDEAVLSWARRKYIGTRDWLQRFGSGSNKGVKWPQSEIDRKHEDLKMFAQIGNMAKARMEKND